mgnify:CR=1 FL=1
MGYGQVSPGSNALVGDARSLNQLKLQAGQASPAAIKETAKQFEALFMREMIKSMREATMKSGLLDSPQGDLGADLLDQQLAVQMSGRPGGLSDMIARQLTRQMSGTAAATPDSSAPAAATPGAGAASPISRAGPSTAPLGNTAPSARQSEFVQRHSAAAAKVVAERAADCASSLAEASCPGIPSRLAGQLVKMNNNVASRTAAADVTRTTRRLPARVPGVAAPGCICCTPLIFAKFRQWETESRGPTCRAGWPTTTGRSRWH